MNKILSFLSLLFIIVYAVPVLAVCSVTGGACSIKDLNKSPENSQNLELSSSPSGAVTQVQPEISNETPIIEGGVPYNSNCQFGVCLPGMLWDNMFDR